MRQLSNGTTNIAGPFQLAGTGVTTTGTKLNYLTNASGTTTQKVLDSVEKETLINELNKLELKKLSVHKLREMFKIAKMEE